MSGSRAYVAASRMIGRMIAAIAGASPALALLTCIAQPPANGNWWFVTTTSPRVQSGVETVLFRRPNAFYAAINARIGRSKILPVRRDPTDVLDGERVVPRFDLVGRQKEMRKNGPDGDHYPARPREQTWVYDEFAPQLEQTEQREKFEEWIELHSIPKNDRDCDQDENAGDQQADCDKPCRQPVRCRAAGAP